jgi:hypothetical protein
MIATLWIHFSKNPRPPPQRPKKPTPEPEW